MTPLRLKPAFQNNSFVPCVLVCVCVCVCVFWRAFVRQLVGVACSNFEFKSAPIAAISSSFIKALILSNCYEKCYETSFSRPPGEKCFRFKNQINNSKLMMAVNAGCIESSVCPELYICNSTDIQKLMHYVTKHHLQMQNNFYVYL